MDASSAWINYYSSRPPRVLGWSGIDYESAKVILQFAEKAANGDLNCQRAALSALSVSCEGCSDSLIEGSHMPRMVFNFSFFWPPMNQSLD